MGYYAVAKITPVVSCTKIMHQVHALNFRNQSPKGDHNIQGDTKVGKNLANFI